MNSRPATDRTGALPAHLRRQASLGHDLLRFTIAKPLGAFGGLVVVALVVTAIFAAYIAPYDPIEIDTPNRFLPPGQPYLLGTDLFGRDVFSRIVWGSRISLYVGLVSVGLGTTSGAVLGVLSGYFGGKTDAAVQRVMDVLLAFPALVLALTVVAMLGPGITNVMLAVAAVIAPSASRVIRSQALSVKQRQYVEAARAIGGTHLRVLLNHVVPNCIAPYIIIATAGLGGAILTEASLSFLGLGTPPPHPSWGGMLAGQARQYIERAPWIAVSPGVALSLAVFGFNLLGDALRDVLDPRLKRA